MTSDSRIHARVIDDHLRAKTFGLCTCIKLVKVANSDNDVCISEKFDSFSFRGMRNEDRDVLSIQASFLLFGSCILDEKD